MPTIFPNERQLDRFVFLFLLALLLLASPLLDWWAVDDAPWYLPYLIWFGLILALFGLQRSVQQNRHDL
ncbi:MAG: hypothetical protein WCX90_07330 [Thiohalomonadaceae bacterium]